MPQLIPPLPIIAQRRVSDAGDTERARQDEARVVEVFPDLRVGGKTVEAVRDKVAAEEGREGEEVEDAD